MILLLVAAIVVVLLDHLGPVEPQTARGELFYKENDNA